jgi:hypothetical protein
LNQLARGNCIATQADEFHKAKECAGENKVSLAVLGQGVSWMVETTSATAKRREAKVATPRLSIPLFFEASIQYGKEN